MTTNNGARIRVPFRAGHLAARYLQSPGPHPERELMNNKVGGGQAEVIDLLQHGDITAVVAENVTLRFPQKKE
jgi:hypothetical protein